MHQDVISPRRPTLRDLAPPLLALLSVCYLLFAARLVKQGIVPTLQLTAFGALNAVVTMQCVTFPVSFVVLGLMWRWDGAAFRKFFRLGNLAAPAAPVRWVGIREGTTWRSVGPSLFVVLTVGTGLFMAGAVSQMGGGFDARFYRLFPLTLALSATNAWTEESFARFTIVAGLDGKLAPAHINWISAAIFGLPHFFGTPGGPIGVLMAAFMGWVLAKSVQETRGMFWAWFLHFIQDVVIFSANIIMLLKA